MIETALHATAVRPLTPLVDINLFVHNGAGTVAAAIGSVLAQSWANWRLTLIDDGSTDGSAAILEHAAGSDSRIQLKRNRCNTGAVGAFQRGLWIGDADFVMPKSADDLIAPDYIERLMGVLDAHPGAAMVHAGGLSFHGEGLLDFVYPESHRLHAIGNDPIARSVEVMRHYTSSPSFWGIYRRDAVDRLAPIAPRAGWDHVVLAELALYGEIRHVPEVLYWRRGTGRPVRDLARAATSEAARGVCLDTVIADPLWRTPCITTAYAHIENFCCARLPYADRCRLIDHACQVFSARWRPLMLREIAGVAEHVAGIGAGLADAPPAIRGVALTQVTRLIAACAILLPDIDLDRERRVIAALLREPVLCPA